MAIGHSAIVWFGFACTVATVFFIVISFASPYWLETWPGSFNEFRNLGLWEICMDKYMHHKDDSQDVYSGCWWVFNLDTRYWKLRDWLLPPWFIATQVMVTGCLIVDIVALMVQVLFLLHCCSYNFEGPALLVAAGLLFLSSAAAIISGCLFGIMSQDREWMPRPDQNTLSWAFGFFIISGICSLVGAFTLSQSGVKEVHEYRKKVDLNMKLMSSYPMTNYPPQGYQPGGLPVNDYPQGYPDTMPPKM